MISVNHIPGFHEFYKAYVKASLFASTTSKGTPLDRLYGPKNFTKEALDQMARDCAKFLWMNARYVGDDYERAGADFWFARNRTGAGFMDGDWPEPAATKLAEAARAFGELNVDADEGVLRIYPGP